MTHPQPNITVHVDITNPGQFFACCGLLELASRMDNRALAWFTPTTFCLAQTPANLIQLFIDTDITPTEKASDEPEEEADKKSVIWIGPPFNLRLDWWRDDNPDQSAVDSKMKTWSAGQKVTDIFENRIEWTKPKRGKPKQKVAGMRGWMKLAMDENPADWLRKARPISKPSSFCLDSRLSRYNAQDQGHTIGGTMAFSPAVDVLALVGLQRFRPLTRKTWEQNVYWPWCVPLSITVAPVAALGHIQIACLKPLEFHVIRRDAAGKFKLIGHAQPFMEMP